MVNKRLGTKQLLLRHGLIDQEGKIRSLRRLIPKLHRQYENVCNGVGYVPNRGIFYTGVIDKWAKRRYGDDVQSAYLIEGNEETVFDLEADSLEEKITKVVDSMGLNCKVTFQDDPRGREVRLFIGNVDVSEILY